MITFDHFNSFTSFVLDIEARIIQVVTYKSFCNILRRLKRFDGSWFDFRFLNILWDSLPPFFSNDWWVEFIDTLKAYLYVIVRVICDEIRFVIQLKMFFFFHSLEIKDSDFSCWLWRLAFRNCQWVNHLALLLIFLLDYPLKSMLIHWAMASSFLFITLNAIQCFFSSFFFLKKKTVVELRAIWTHYIYIVSISFPFFPASKCWWFTVQRATCFFHDAKGTNRLVSKPFYPRSACP